MEINIAYFELEKLLKPYVKSVSIRYADYNTAHLKIKVSKFMISQTIDIDVIILKIDSKNLYLRYKGDVSWLVNKAINWGLIDNKLPRYVKREGKSFTIDLSRTPQIPSFLKLKEILFNAVNMSVKLEIK
ncbi:hypothetical protein [Segatella bryantii]|uniref:hypothetical protein n=1 Tax=Segatella bryantii TaxID=77095 RepID=UPI002479549D|nr:hypothetical protein [Segatella bryantii]